MLVGMDRIPIIEIGLRQPKVRLEDEWNGKIACSIDYIMIALSLIGLNMVYWYAPASAAAMCT
jgi:hypothetical protein